MAIGQVYTIRFHENALGAPVLDSVAIAEFNHADGYATTTTSVVKEDFTGSPNDTFAVKVAYPFGSVPNHAVATVDDITQIAIDAVNAAYGDGEAGDPTAP